MNKFKIPEFGISLSIPKSAVNGLRNYFSEEGSLLMIVLLSALSICAYGTFYFNGLGLAYNDARSHLDIGRRVVEGLKPGIAQLGSVWLPLPHILMIPTIWNDFMWHSGLSGALVSMLSFVFSGFLIYSFLKELEVGILGRIIGVAIFAVNLNILYLQSTAMTELLLVVTSTASAYYLMLWSKKDKTLDLIKSGFWVALASLTRYDGWFLFLVNSFLVLVRSFSKPNIIFKEKYHKMEGSLILFSTLGAFGIFLWFLWNQLIFRDWLYFAFGPYSAHAQQAQLETAGNLVTKDNLSFSVQTYFYALFYNIGTFTAVLGFLGALVLWFDKNLKNSVKLATLALISPIVFNVLALYLGFSVLFIQGISGNTWFNARYGVMAIPAVAVFIGFMVDRLAFLRAILIGLLIFVSFFSVANFDAVTIDDARVGSSQKNVTEISGWLNQNAKDKVGFILISAASHDAIIFSSGLPMSRFIHEGTGAYWESATTNPEHWARWIVMRTYDNNDQTYKAVSKTPDFAHYDLVDKYPFADIYQLKDQYLPYLNTKPVFKKQK